jgi:hypothetical protein
LNLGQVQSGQSLDILVGQTQAGLFAVAVGSSGAVTCCAVGVGVGVAVAGIIIIGNVATAAVSKRTVAQV